MGDKSVKWIGCATCSAIRPEHHYYCAVCDATETRPTPGTEPMTDTTTPRDAAIEGGH